ncbi:Metallo-dependent phosphatase, partial [Fistulina hepatica ATCC 64428]
LNPYPDKPRLVFKDNGTFKITVLSDLHYGENPWDAWGPEQDVNSTHLMRMVLPEEQPDYVVINGDLITGEGTHVSVKDNTQHGHHTFKDNATLLIDEIVAPLNDFKIPFSSTYGNHDNEINITHAEEMARERLVAPLSYTRPGPKGVGGIGGPANYWVPFTSSSYNRCTAESPCLVLWFFDSRGTWSSGFQTNGSAMPDWVDVSVADWIKSETEAMESAWGSAENRSAMAFVHIPPLSIFSCPQTLNKTESPGLNADVLGSGSTQATTDSANIGKDEPFWTAVNTYITNLRAVISGHDHGNEWCARDTSKNVIFCFDKHTGYGGYSSTGWGHGIRNIIFTSTDPTADIETWIRLEYGHTRAYLILNAEYDT